MNELFIKLFSGINSDGFEIEIPNKFKKRYSYGYNVSYDKNLAKQSYRDIEIAKQNNWNRIPIEKPYVSDIIYDIAVKYNIDPENINVIIGKNTFSDSITNEDEIKYFTDKYLLEVFEKLNTL